MRTAILAAVFLALMPMAAHAKHDILRQSVRQYVNSVETKMPARMRTLSPMGGTYIREREFRWR
jgi:hypothetical protein